MTFGLTDQFHTGFVVPRLDKALDELGDLLGCRWSAVRSFDYDAWTPRGREQLPLKVVYSVDEPHIELIQAQPGTVWAGGDHITLHHLGFWVDDLAQEAARVETLGLVRELAGAADDSTEPTGITYHRHPSGLRIELVDRAMMPDLQQWWSQPAPK